MFLKKFKKVAIARAIISSKNYSPRRSEDMSRNVLFWRMNAADSKTKIQREVCIRMSEMYLKRYKWYLNRI